MAFWARCMLWGHRFPLTVKNRHTLNSMYSCMFWFGRYSCFIASWFTIKKTHTHKEKHLKLLRPIQYSFLFFFSFWKFSNFDFIWQFSLNILLSVVLMCLTVVILLHRVGGISTKGMDEPRRCYGRSYLELYGSVIRLKDIAPAQPQLVEQGCMVVWGCTSKLLTESGVSRCFESSSAKEFFFFFHLITSRELFFCHNERKQNLCPKQTKQMHWKSFIPHQYSRSGGFLIVFLLRVVTLPSLLPSLNGCVLLDCLYVLPDCTYLSWLCQ